MRTLLLLALLTQFWGCKETYREVLVSCTIASPHVCVEVMINEEFLDDESDSCVYALGGSFNEAGCVYTNRLSGYCIVPGGKGYYYTPDYNLTTAEATCGGTWVAAKSAFHQEIISDPDMDFEALYEELFQKP